MEKIALVPEIVGTPGPEVVLYGEDHEFTEGQLQACGFFVPHYMGPQPNLHAMAQMPNLEICQLLTAGFDHAMTYLPLGATLCNAKGVHDASTSELAIGLILASLRGIDDAARDMTSGAWNHRPHVSLADRRVLVIGAGGVGRAIHDRLLPFEVTIRMMARTSRDGIATPEQLPVLLPQCDIVVIAVPFNDSTQHLVDAVFLSQMRDGALLVNVSRGAVVDTEALLAETGRLHFALDVTDPEPLPLDHPLWSSPGVLITPHLGGDTTAFIPRARRLVSEQVVRWQSGRQVDCVVVKA
ncbi:MAG: 2-hydroxyacid dehydrogenase [Candidatus Nanopelagicales bacterium]